MTIVVRGNVNFNKSDWDPFWFGTPTTGWADVSVSAPLKKKAVIGIGAPSNNYSLKFVGPGIVRIKIDEAFQYTSGGYVADLTTTVELRPENSSSIPIGTITGYQLGTTAINLLLDQTYSATDNKIYEIFISHTWNYNVAGSPTIVFTLEAWIEPIPVSNYIQISTQEGAPKFIGQKWGGGYFAGLISYNADGWPTHYLVVAPISTGELAANATSFIANAISSSQSQGNTSEYDGAANTNIMADGNHPAADWAKALTIGDYSDWYVPSIMELDVLYYYLKPENVNNSTSYGINPYSVPIRSSNFTTTVPPQTTESDWQHPFGTEKFHSTTWAYWSSTQRTGSTQWWKDFYNGSRGYDIKESPNYVRAIRKVPWPIDEVLYPGQVSFTVPGTYYWTAPNFVYSICVVCVGGGGAGGATNGGGGGGGGLGWKNNIPVVPGTSYKVVVGAGGTTANGVAWSSGVSGSGGESYFLTTATVSGGGGGGGFWNLTVGPNVVSGGSGGTYIGSGGGNGGTGGSSYYNDVGVGGQGGAGGGAGGYSGNGGKGGDGFWRYDFSWQLTNATGSNGSGGGAGGGGGGLGVYENGNGTGAGAGGGGVGLLGQGSNGAGGNYNIGSPTGDSTPGGGGSSGANGGENVNNFFGGQIAGVGGNFGGGGGGGMGYWNSAGGAGVGNGASGGNGAVRIIWGEGRAFPATNTQNITSF